MDNNLLCYKLFKENKFFLGKIKHEKREKLRWELKENVR